MDAFFSKDITKEEMRWMNERYDRELEELHSSLQAAREREKLSYDTTTLQADVKAHIKELMDRGVDELFEKEMLDVAIIYPDRRLEVRLNLLPMQWRFVLDAVARIRRKNGCHYDPSVPMSVSRPLASA